MREIVLVDPRGVRWQVEVAETRAERATGLLARSTLLPGRALLLPKARSVHTVGMMLTIRAALLDRDLRVLRVLRLHPGSWVLPRPRVRHILEYADLPNGPQLRPGDRLTWDERGPSELPGHPVQAG